MITIVRADDWVGIYVDGELKTENHSLDEDDLLDVLGIEHKVVWADEYLNKRGRCPQDLKDVIPDEDS